MILSHLFFYLFPFPHYHQPTHAHHQVHRITHPQYPTDSSTDACMHAIVWQVNLRFLFCPPATGYDVFWLAVLWFSGCYLWLKLCCCGLTPLLVFSLAKLG